MINEFLQNHEAPKVVSNAKNYKSVLDWKVYTHSTDDPDGWQNSYRILGSMFSYIYFNFGEYAARRAIYRVYENKENITAVLCEDIKCTIDEFLAGWSVWMTSSGKTTSTAMASKIKAYKDKLTWYDYNRTFIKIHTVNGTQKAEGTSPVIKNGNIVYNENLSTGNIKLIH